jgi:RNA polymerase sigma factor (sigma-70 family)
MPLKNTDEKDLQLRYFRGEERAFAELYRRYRLALLGLAQRRGASLVEAEDLVQETFVATYTSRKRFRGTSQLWTYLVAILQRRQSDLLRRRRPTGVLEMALAIDSSPEQHIVAATVLEAALAQLDPALREAFLLVVAQGLTSKEAGERLNTPAATIRWRVSEASKRLRTLLSEDDT